MGKMDNMEEKAHALLGASNSHRWLECTPSARIEELYPDEGSGYALEGTVAHAVAASLLKGRLGIGHADEDAEIEAHKELVTGEMRECAEDYAEFVLSRFDLLTEWTPNRQAKPVIDIERRLDYSHYVKDGFGTGDAVIVCHDHIEIIDFKYGKGVKVDAERNTQMMLYALGAMAEYDYLFDVNYVRLTIYQPRLRNISTWDISGKDLTDWADDVLAPLAAVAYRGLGARKSGDWCRFCKAKAECPRVATDSLAYYMVNPNGEALTPEGYAQILEDLGKIKDWLKAVEDRSLQLAMDGTEIPGFKVVEGRSVRKIVDPEGVAKALETLGAAEDEIYRPRELRTLTDLERTFGKKEFTRWCGAWIEKPAGKPTLVPVSDRREGITDNDFKDLKI